MTFIRNILETRNLLVKDGIKLEYSGYLEVNTKYKYSNPNRYIFMYTDTYFHKLMGPSMTIISRNPETQSNVKSYFHNHTGFGQFDDGFPSLGDLTNTLTSRKENIFLHLCITKWGMWFYNATTKQCKDINIEIKNTKRYYNEFFGGLIQTFKFTILSEEKRSKMVTSFINRFLQDMNTKTCIYIDFVSWNNMDDVYRKLKMIYK